MKRTILFLVVTTILNVNSYLIKVPTVFPNDNTVPVTVARVHMQKILTPLFEDVCEESSEPIIVRLSGEFQLNPKDGDFTNLEVIDNFLNLKSTKGLLAKGEIFSEYNQDHMLEFKIIYEMLYNAENFDTFYKVACWARQNVNCGIFVDAIYLAIIKRRDTERVLLPALYEVLPNYFVRKDYIIKASSLLSGADSSIVDYLHDDGNSYVIDVNYTDNYSDNNIEQMSYFYEDVGLNTYYFFNKLKMLKWAKNEISDARNQRGQYIYHQMKQLNTRYNLERYSNGIPEVEAINWDVNDESIYDPMLIYSNGKEFSQISFNTENKDNILIMKNIENNITSIVTHMRDAGYNKSEIFNYLMDILVTGEMSYENLAIQLLSNLNTQTATTSVLSHYMTALRDPIFWRVNKRIVEMVDDAMKVLPAYDRNQLYFPGVEVTNIDVKKLLTSCDKYEFDVTDALRNKEVESRFQIKINQYRLSHKPFSIKISISSLVMEKALIKLYIGPKVLPGQFTDRKNLFMLLDSFEVNLKIGSNSITRTSDEINNLSDEFISLKTIRKYIQDAEFGIDALPLRSLDSQTSFPSRLILPKGTTTPFQIFVFVAPYVKAIVGGSRNYLQSNYDAILSPGYPLDLDIEIQNLFDLPNALVKDIVITHKSSTVPLNSETNGYYNWQKNNTEFNNRGAPTYFEGSYPKPSYQTKNFDYKTQKSKYGKKQDEMEPKVIKNDYEKVITLDKDINKNFTKDNQDEEKIVNSDSVIIDIDSKREEYGNNKDEIATKIVENDYGKVINIDKKKVVDFSQDKRDEEEDSTHFSNVNDEDKKLFKNDYEKIITVDKNINYDSVQDKRDENININVIHENTGEKEKNRGAFDFDKLPTVSYPKKKMYDLWWRK